MGFGTSKASGVDFRPVAMLIRTDIQLSLLLIAACVIGGGGVGDAMRNLAVQLLAIVLLAVNGPETLRLLQNAPRALLALVFASLALPLIQLVPLPPSIWTHLPGRDLVVESLGFIGQADGWFGISVAPHRTAVAFIGLIVPFAALVLTYNLDLRGGDRQRKLILAVLVGLGVFNVLLGAMQVGASSTIASDYISGTFANKNSTGEFLLISLLALFGLAATKARTINRQIFTYAIAALLVLGIIASYSKSATGLLLVVIPVCIVLARMNRPAAQGQRKLPLTATIVGAFLLVLATGILVHTNERLNFAVSRFAVVDETRLNIWSDAMDSAHRFWPVGAGMGTFDEVAQIDESLETVPGGRAGRAHNDFLEIAVEAGLPGLVLLAAWLAYLVILVVDTKGARSHSTRAVALAGTLCLAMQSIVDYPLRNQAMLCVLGIFLGLLCPPHGERAVRRRQDWKALREGDVAKEADYEETLAGRPGNAASA